MMRSRNTIGDLVVSFALMYLTLQTEDPKVQAALAIMTAYSFFMDGRLNEQRWWLKNGFYTVKDKDDRKAK